MDQLNEPGVIDVAAKVSRLEPMMPKTGNHEDHGNRGDEDRVDATDVAWARGAGFFGSHAGEPSGR
jgi:hypothetical protein